MTEIKLPTTPFPDPPTFVGTDGHKPVFVWKTSAADGTILSPPGKPVEPWVIFDEARGFYTEELRAEHSKISTADSLIKTVKRLGYTVTEDLLRSLGIEYVAEDDTYTSRKDRSKPIEPVKDEW